MTAKWESDWYKHLLAKRLLRLVDEGFEVGLRRDDRLECLLAKVEYREPRPPHQRYGMQQALGDRDLAACRLGREYLIRVRLEEARRVFQNEGILPERALGLGPEPKESYDADACKPGAELVDCVLRLVDGGCDLTFAPAAKPGGIDFWLCRPSNGRSAFGRHLQDGVGDRASRLRRQLDLVAGSDHLRDLDSPAAAGYPPL